jgi:hypothetical protein
MESKPKPTSTDSERQNHADLRERVKKGFDVLKARKDRLAKEKESQSK